MSVPAQEAALQEEVPEQPRPSYYAVPTNLLVAIAEYLFTQPYGSVNRLIDAIDECAPLPE